MAINRATLRIERELAAWLATIGDAQVRALVEAWVIAWDQVAGEVDAAALELVESAVGGRVTAAMVHRSQRAQRALDAVAAALDNLASQTSSIVSADVHAAIERAITAERDMIASQLTGVRRATLAADLVHVDSLQVAEMVRRATEQITSTARPLAADAYAAIRRDLLRGIAVGVNPRTAARRMVAGIEDRFNGGLTRAMTVARTEMLDATRRAAQAVDRANADVLQGWVWVASLGPRTCRSCVANHGTVHDIDEPGPIDHQNGRCARVPKTKSWTDLGFKGIPDPPDVTPDADAWFASLSQVQQRGILGKAGFDAWQRGAYPRDAWTTRRTTDGWRDSMIPSRMPGSGGSGRVPPRPPQPAAGGPWRDPLRESVYRPRPAGQRGSVHVPAGLRVEAHELEAARRLADAGFTVSFNPLSHEVGVKNPDVTIERMIWEIKCPKGAGRKTIDHQFERGARQADRIIIDAARTVLDDDEILAKMRRRLSGTEKFAEAMFIAKDGTVTRLTR